MKGCDVSITIDHWTSKQNLNYVGITAHWIDKNWTMNSIPLGLFLHEGTSKSTDIMAEFLCQMSRLIAEEASIFAVTSDTDATMNKFGLALEKKDYIHLYCTDHVLHLTCKKCYIKSSYGNDTEKSIVKKASDIVLFFNSSPQALEQLKSMQGSLHQYTTRKVGVVTDVVTRWWSTYKMCKRLIYLKDAITMVQTLPDEKKLSDDEWDELKEVAKVLQPF